MDWTKNLERDVYERLCDCRSLKSDIPKLVNAKWASYKESGRDKKEGLTKENALIAVLDLLDCNSQPFGDNLTEAEWDSLCR